MLSFRKYIAIFTILLLSLSTTLAQESTFSKEEVELQNKVRGHLNAAREYLSASKEDLAKLEIDSALQLAPKNWVANTMMGDLMNNRTDYLHALLSYDKAILINSTNPTLYYKRAELHIKLNNHREYIVGDYDRAIEIDPANTLYYIQKAHYYANTVNPDNFKTDYQSAINTINDALVIYPENPELFNLKSKYLLGDHQNLSALTEVNKAIVLDPTNDIYLAQRGNVNYEITRYRAALADFNRAIKINNNSSFYYKYRGHTNFNLNQYAEAYDDYSSSIDLIISKIEGKRGSVSYDGSLNKDLRGLLVFRGMSLVHDDRPYDGCDDFKRASQMGETKARNYIRKYCN
jgi:tetratricopeptide (TPR) repeat protein